MIAYLVGNALFSDYFRSITSPHRRARGVCGAVLGADWVSVVQRAAGIDFMATPDRWRSAALLGSMQSVKHEIVLAVIGAVRAGSGFR